MPNSDSMTRYAITRLQKLGEKYDWIIKAQVYFKLGQGKTGENKICEIELSVPGPRIFASSTEKNYEMAVKETLSDLEKQLKKRRQTFRPHHTI